MPILIMAGKDGTKTAIVVGKLRSQLCSSWESAAGQRGLCLGLGWLVTALYWLDWEIGDG